MQQIKHHFHSPALGLFLIRFVAGVIFIFHGVQKLSNMEGTIAFFGSIGFGALLAWAVALVEVAGGLSLILGIWTKVFGALLAAIMITALFKLKIALGFVASEIDLMLLATSLAVIFSGCGKYSICKFWHKDCTDCKDSSGCGCSHGTK